MSYAVQYDLFESNDEESLTRQELNLVKKELANVRKGIFSRLEVMRKEFELKFNMQQEEIDILRKKLNEKSKILDFKTLRGKKI